MTQVDTVLALLRQRGAEGLTPLEALQLAGTMRLAARIADLRDAGHLITTEIVTTPNGKRIAKYRLEEGGGIGIDKHGQPFIAWPGEPARSLYDEIMLAVKEDAERRKA